MSLKPGYKQTEIGVIPESWELYKFSDHFHIYAGGDVPKHSVSQHRSVAHPFPIFANSTQDRGLYGFTVERRANADSMTITARGYVGHAEYRDEEFFPVGRLLVLEPIGALDAGFATYAVNERVRFAIESTGVPQLTAPQVGKYAIAAPTHFEQRRISEALSEVDALIDSLEALLTKKRNIKTGVMQELLTGRTRLPGFTGDWQIRKLKDVAELLSGGTPSTAVAAYWGGGIPWCTPTDITSTKGNFITSTEQTITADGVKSSSATILPVGSILLCTRATIGEAKITTVAMTTNQGFKSLVVRAGVSNIFMYFLMSTKKRVLLERSSGSTFLEISKKELGSIDLWMPEFDEQKAIAALLSDIDDEIEALEKRLAKTRDLKQGMAQELLTGRTRLV